MPTLFWGQFSQNSLVGDAWLTASLVHQHTLCHPPKMWALQVSKNGRTVKSIYSHNIFSSFATKKWHFYRKYAQPPGRWGGGHVYGKNAYDKMGLGIFAEKKSSLIKPSKSMLFFHIWNANFSVTPINSQMYMTKPKQVQKNSQKILGKLFP